MTTRTKAHLGVLLGVLTFLILGLGATPAQAQEEPSILGSILDTTGGPVEGITVTVTGPDDFTDTGTSDAQGTFQVPVPAPGDYRLVIDPEVVPDGITVPDRYSDGINTTVSPDGTGTVTIQLRSSESLRGNMKNGDEALVGAEVTVESADGSFSETATTDDEGHWEVFLPSAGQYTVSLDPDELPEGVTVREGTASELTLSVSTGQQRAVLFSFGEDTRNVLGFGDQALQLIVEGLRFGLLLALAALGLSLIFGTTGLVNFAHGEMVALGAIIVWALNVSGVPFVFAALITVAVCAVIGGAQEVILWRPLRKRRTGLIAMMIVTIGLSIFARFLFLYFIGAQPRSYADFVTQGGIQFGPVSLAPRDMWSMVIALVVLVGVAMLLIFSRIGKAMRAVSDNQSLAAASGIDVNRVILFVWVTGGGLAALGGILLGLSQQVKFDMGFDLLLLLFAGVVLGGLGTAFGALAGSLVVGLFVTVSTLWIPSELKNVAALAVLIIILLVRPQGILGRAERVG